MIFIYILMIAITLVLALSFILRALQIKRSNLITEGTIISVRCKKVKISDYRGYTILYFPTFKFNVDGKEYIKESFSATEENIYKEGQQIKVAYYKENPMDAMILNDKKSKFVISIGLTIFIILSGLSLVLSSLDETKLFNGSLFSPSYILLVIAFIVLIICCFINHKKK